VCVSGMEEREKGREPNHMNQLLYYRYHTHHTHTHTHNSYTHSTQTHTPTHSLIKVEEKRMTRGIRGKHKNDRVIRSDKHIPHNTYSHTSPVCRRRMGRGEGEEEEKEKERIRRRRG
jgi:hypothetical protein